MKTREIKFRAFHKEQKVLVYDNEDDSEDYWDGVVSSNVGMANAILKGDRYIWMQFTGLLDKNGKEIYEGDILSNTYNKWVVEWCTEVSSFRLIKKLAEGFDNHSLSMFQPEIYSEFEIIGNIYTTPELLSTTN